MRVDSLDTTHQRDYNADDASIATHSWIAPTDHPVLTEIAVALCKLLIIPASHRARRDAFDAIP